MLRKFFVGLSLAALMSFMMAGLWPQTAAAAPAFPGIISLPDGFQPEGVVTGRGPIIYAGSLADGSIYRANLRTGEGEILVDAPGGMAVGLAFDSRSNYLFVSGGAAGTATVYDADSGAFLVQYQLTTGPAFINDAIVTREAVYFTNSFAPEIYRVPLGPGGSLPDASAVETIPLTGDFVFIPNNFNANGIEATANGRYLLIVSSAAQTVYRVDPHTGEAVAIDLGGPLPNGDGLVLVGHTLYVVQNQLNQIAVVELDNSFTSGTVVDTLSNSALDVPTTAALFGNKLYAVNARFGVPDPATAEYDIVQVTR